MSNEQLQLKRLDGMVAQIINARELAINIGKEHGVRKGMKFAVLAEQGLEIRDPETNEFLDKIDREKVRVEAMLVRPKITICRTYQTRRIPAGPFYTDLSSITGLTRPPREEVETLKADDSSYPEPLSPEDSYVKIGDNVVQIE